MHQQRRGHEQHDAQGCQQREARNRFELLHSEDVIKARNGKCPGDQAGQIGVQNDQYAPRDNGLVRVHIAGEWGDFSHVTSLSIPT